MSMSLKRFLSYVLVLAMVISLLPGVFLIDTVKAADSSYTVLTDQHGDPVSQDELKAAIMEGYDHLMWRTGTNGRPAPIWYDLYWNSDSWENGRPVLGQNADGSWNRVNNTGNGMYQDSSRTASEGGIRAMNCTDFVAWMYGYWLEQKGYQNVPTHGSIHANGAANIDGQDSVAKLVGSWLKTGSEFEMEDIRGMSVAQIAATSRIGDVLTFSNNEYANPFGDAGSTYGNKNGAHSAIFIGDYNGVPSIMDCTPSAGQVTDPNDLSYWSSHATSEPGVRIRPLVDQVDASKGRFPMAVYHMTPDPIPSFDLFGYINAKKVGSDNTNKYLEATFKVYTDAACTIPYAQPTFTTSATGAAVKIGLKDENPIDLYFKESSVPAGYQIDGTVYKVTVNSGHTQLTPATITLATGGALADGKIVNQPGGNGEAHIIVDYNIPGFTATATTDTQASSTVDCGAHKVGDTVTLKLALNGTSLAKDTVMTLYNQNDVKVTAKFRGLSTSADGALDVTHKGGDTYEYKIQHDGLTILYAVWELDANCSKTHGDGDDDLFWGVSFCLVQNIETK